MGKKTCDGGLRWSFWMTAKMDVLHCSIWFIISETKPLAPDGPNTRWILTVTDEGGGLSSWGLTP